MKFGYSGSRGMSATDIADSPNPVAFFHPHPFKGLSPVAMRQPCLLVALPFDTTLLAMLPHRSQCSGAASHLAPCPAWICITKCFCARSKRGVLLAGKMWSTGAWGLGGWRRLLAIQARNCGSNPWPWSGPCLGSSPAPDNVKVWYFAWNAFA